MKNRQNRTWLTLVALVALLLSVSPGAAFVTNMTIGVNGVQGFETYSGTNPTPVSVTTNFPDGWVLSNVGIYSKTTPDFIQQHTGSNAAWFANFASGESAVISPLLTDGVGLITFWVRSRTSVFTNWYALETSTDYTNWVVRDSIKAPMFNTSWGQVTGTVNRSESAYLRLRLTNQSPINANATKLDDLVIGYPQATVAFANALPSPNPPTVNVPFDMTVTVTPDGLVSNTTVTNFWSIDGGVNWDRIGMVTNGVNTWVTTNPIPKQSAVTIKYYFTANFQGPDAVPLNSATNEFTVQVPAYVSGYNSLRVQGDLNTNFWLVGSYSWLGVAQSSAAVTNALIKFRSVTTNQPPTTNLWGDVAQAKNVFRIDGTASTNGTDIEIGGSNSGAFIFTFIETNLAYTISHGVYQSFDAWTSGNTSNAGWTSAAGMNFGDANHTYRSQSARLPPNGWVMTPLLSQGIGQINFWYRDFPSNGLPATTCSVQKSLDGAAWTTLTNLAINNSAYQGFSLTVEDRNSRYVRLLNGTNVQLCLDDVIVSDPFWAGVAFGAVTNTPADPTATNAVTVSAVINPAVGTSNLIATLYYRSGSTGAYSTLAMTNSGTTFSNTVAIPPRIGPDGGAGLVQYFIGCTFQGYNSVLTSPAYYPPDTNFPSSYSIVRSYLVLTNAAMLPVAPNTTNTITLALDVLPFAAASNANATSYYSFASSTGPFTAIGMTTTGGNHFVTTSAIPATNVPGTMLYYYFTASSAGANPIVPTNYPVGGAATPLSVQIHAAPFGSAYTNLVTTGGGLAPGMILVSNGLWQGVAQTTNLINPGFVFTGQNGGTTNFGAVTQPVTNYPFYGVASGGAGNIVLYGTNNGPLVFSFDENSHTWSVLRANYVNFDIWTNGAGGYGTYTNSDGWVLTDGRVTSNSAPDSNLTFVGRSGILNGGPATNQSLRSPQLTNGIGQISFWYRNAQTNGVPAAGFTVEVAPLTNGPWTTVAAVSNVLSSDYLYFSTTRSDRDNSYVRIRNLATSSHPALCLDEVIVAEPGAGVGFSAITNTPANPTATNAVTVSAVIAPLAGASSLIATLYYRSGSTGAYSTLAMTNSGTTFSNTVAIPPGIGPDGRAGLVQYFVGCTFQGYNSSLTSPSYYPPDTNSPSSYSIVRSYLVLTNAATLPVAPNTTNAITLALDVLPFAAASNATATAYYSIGSTTGPFTSLGMTTTGGNHFVTTSAIPATNVPGTMLYYYFTASSDGANPIVPTNYPVGGAATPLSVQIHAAPFGSAYTNLVTTGGGLAPGMILVSNGLWQGVMVATNLVNTGFVFTGQNAGGTTNFGAVTQPVTNYPFYGVASGGAGNIVLYGTNNGPLVFSFDENSHTWSVLRANYVNFDIWTNGTGGYGNYTNSDGWVLTDGRVTSTGAPDSALAFVGRSGILNGGSATNQSLRSPQLTNGIGQISFWYRNAQTNGVPAAGFTVEVAPLTNGPWTTVAAVSNVLSSDYLYFTTTRSDRDNSYVRIRNLTITSHPALCLDEVIVAEPGAGVSFSSVTNTPAAPTFLDNVYISAILTPLSGATGISARVYYRDNTNTDFEYVGMSTTGGNYYVTATNLYSTAPGNSIQYFLKASYGGFQSALSSPAQYPAAGQPLLSYLTSDRTNNGDRVQGFETYSGTNPTPVSVTTNFPDGWGLSNVGIYSKTTPDFSQQHTGSNAAWFANFDSGESSVISPLLTDGVGLITFWVRSRTYVFTNWYALETSTDYTNWVVRDSITAPLFNTSWGQFTGTVNRSESAYLRLRLTNQSPINANATKLDDLVITYPPALVSVTNVIVVPGYPSYTDTVLVACDVVSVSKPFAAFGITPKLWYRIGGTTNGPIPMNSIGGVRYQSATAIPAQPVNTLVEYSIQVDFSGYYGSPGEKKSPFFYPGGPKTQGWTKYPSLVRRGGSDYGGVDVMVNNSPAHLDLISPYQWQGIFMIETLTNQAVINLQGLNPYTNGATQYGQTITLGDTTQWKTNAPLAGIAQAGGSNFTMNGALQGQYVFQYNEQSGQYVLRACVYQDFNNGWYVTDPYYAFGSADNTPPVRPYFSLWGTNAARQSFQKFVSNNTWDAMAYSNEVKFYAKNPNTFWGASQCEGPTTNNELQMKNSENNGFLVRPNNDISEAWRGVGTLSMHCRITTSSVSATVGFYLCPTNLLYEPYGNNWINVANYAVSNNLFNYVLNVHTSANMAVILAHVGGNESVFVTNANVTEWYADTRTVGVSRAESFVGDPWTTVLNYTNGLISSTTDYGIYGCKITSASGINWAETMPSNNQGYVVQANRDLGLVGVGTLQVTAWAPNGDTTNAGLAIYLAPRGQHTNQALWGTAVWSTLLTNNATTNIQVTVNRATNASVVFAHTGGNTPLLLSALNMTSYDASNAWVASEVWMESNTVNQCHMDASRADAGTANYLRSPLIRDRAIQINVTWLAGDTNNAAAFDVYVTPGNNATSWGTNKLAFSRGSPSGAYASAQTNSYILPVNSTNLFFWVLNTSSNPGVLIIRDVEVIRQRSTSLWLGNNVDVVKDSRTFNGDLDDQKSCFLNSNSVSDASLGQYDHVLSDIAPFVQSPMVTSGVGEVSFWYRNWNTSGVPSPATLTVLASQTGGTNAVGWVPLATISNIVNTNDYIYFTYINYDSSNHYVRIQNNTNPPAARVCLDNVIVVAPMACDVVLSNLTISPRIPIYTNTVDVTIDLADPFLFPTNIQLTAYYQTATNYGGWSGTPNSRAMTCIDSNPAARWWRYQTTSRIPANPVDTFVKYWVGATFQGYLTQATASHPKVNQAFVTPTWYRPVNYGTSNAYYVVFSCPTGAVWINELNLVDDTYGTTKQFVELAGLSGTPIGNWRIERYLANSVSTTSQTFNLTSGTVLRGIPTNGYGFWVLSTTNISPRDMFFTNVWPPKGGLALKRSFGAIEQAICYGNPRSDVSVLEANGFTYIGYDYLFYDDPLYLYGDLTNGLQWSNYTGLFDPYTPGAANYGEIFPPLPLPEPTLTSTAILSIWLNTNVWIMCTGTNGWAPTPWYATNLALQSASWTNVPVFSSSYPAPMDGPYTVNFPRMTNAAAYFYKIVTTTNATP